MTRRHHTPRRHHLPRDRQRGHHTDPVLTITGADPAGAERPAAPGPGPLGPLVATDLSYRRRGRTVLEGVSLIAYPGQSLAVTGPSGSGKSSLLALLAGLEQPDTGTVHHDPPQARIGLVLQGYGLTGLLTAAENIEIVLQPRVAAGNLTRAQVRGRAAAALYAVGIPAVADHLVEQLSGGQQQRVALARALTIEPHILLADEFTTELDHETKQRALELTLDIAHHGGLVIIATHDNDIASQCDHILHLVDGHPSRTQTRKEPRRKDTMTE